MGIQRTAKHIVVSCALAGAMALGACASGANSALTEDQQARRAYMSQVNETMVELESTLDSFVDAVSRGDVVNMRTQADVAYKSLDKLSALEAPELLADVHKGYLEGTGELKDALDAYITLYAEAESGKLDWSKYDSRIKAVQEQYDKGVAALEEADKKAAEA